LVLKVIFVINLAQEAAVKGFTLVFTSCQILR
jgi:hypothetical protein